MIALRAKKKPIFYTKNRSNRRYRSPLRYFRFETGVPLAQVSRKGRSTPYRPFLFFGTLPYLSGTSWTRPTFPDSALHSLDVPLVRLRSCALIRAKYALASLRQNGEGGSLGPFWCCLLDSAYFTLGQVRARQVLM